MEKLVIRLREEVRYGLNNVITIFFACGTAGVTVVNFFI